jgi:5'-nucleotidase
MPTHSNTPNPETQTPLILVTNDDGITSPGLRATVDAARPLGEILVVAPARQWSGASRSVLLGPQAYVPHRAVELDGCPAVTAYQVDAPPAVAVLYGALKLAPRRPALLISGINYGENLGSDVTISGTVGAALQGAALGIPSLAVSLQAPKETHVNPSDDVDFAAAIHFTRRFARWMLQVTLPFDVDVLKIDIPADATPDTPWRLTRVSRQTYFIDVPPPPQGTRLADPTGSEDPTGPGDGVLDYEPLPHPEWTERDSDIYALAVDHVVSVAPVSLDVTSRTDFGEIEALLYGLTR